MNPEQEARQLDLIPKEAGDSLQESSVFSEKNYHPQDISNVDWMVKETHISTPKPVFDAQDLTFGSLAQKLKDTYKTAPEKVEPKGDFEQSVDDYAPSAYRAPEAYDVPKISRTWVHKVFENNVVVSDPILLDSDRLAFRTRLVLPMDNKFFFDHDYDHLPGMLQIEGARQICTAICHLYFQTPMDYGFILNEMTSNFVGFAHIDDLSFVDLVFSKVKYKGKQARKFSAYAFLHQKNTVLGQFYFNWTVVPKSLQRKFEK